MPLLVLEDQAEPRRGRDVEHRLSPREARLSSLEGVVEIDQHRELALVFGIPSKWSVVVRDELVALIIAIESEPFVEASRSPEHDLLGNMRGDALPDGSRERRVIVDGAGVVADLIVVNADNTCGCT